MVIMSMETYERSSFLNNVYDKLEEAKLDLKNKKVCKPEDSVKRIKEKNLEESPLMYPLGSNLRLQEEEYHRFLFKNNFMTL